jgi:peroxiredoxin
MTEIEKLFHENKSSFDRLEPNPDSWTSLKEAMETGEKRKRPVKKRRLMLFSAAASVLAILSISFLINSKSNGNIDFHDISMYSPDGTEIPLDPSSNKLTLVQFWASGNVMCIEENCFYFRPAYKKYRDKGFEIYAISLDEDKDSWQTSIEENNLPWIHVSDLMGWDSPICEDCNVTQIPASFLLNQDGEILARDLNAEELDETLESLLAQY